MQPVLNVAVAGAAGMIGSSIVEALKKTGRYNITAITRSANTHEFQAGLQVLEVDYNSLESLTAALEGQHVVISALGKFALGHELLLIDAALLAGVRRVIPSEFGGDLLNPRTRAMPNYQEKVVVQERLKAHASRPGSTMTYTLIFSNVLLDWSLRSGFVVDPERRELRRYDGGNDLYSTSRVSTVGQAVVGVLDNLEATENQAVYIQDIAITQNAMLALVREEIIALSYPSERSLYATTLPAESISAPEGSGPISQELLSQNPATSAWTMVDINSSQVEQDARVALANGGTQARLFYAFAAKAAFVDGYGGHFRKLDNKLLGIEPLSIDALRAVIRDELSSHIASEENYQIVAG